MGISKHKKSLRKLIADHKCQASPQQLSEESREIVEAIEQLEVFQKAHTILAYWPISGEVDLRDLLNRWQTKKELLLPVVKDDFLEIRLFEGENNLAAGLAYGILEPTGAPFKAFRKIDLVLVPGVAFDREGYRLGRGKAYYDRLLPKLTNAHKLGVGFSFQLVDQVPSEPHDELMDAVVIPNPK
ncbi:MAG: 5-formyltetrahydrofolate cyclo-ligase [Bacteroidales bacterium]|nr:5-formyltetrahydrofolate cyclo-ligase [Bacteroidales bacterium]